MRLRYIPCWCLCLLYMAGPVIAQDKPNIVLIFMDNFGWGELGCYGGGILRGAETPRIDSLARDGMRLLNFNVEAQCTPSRAAIMTGRYAVRTGNGQVPIGSGVYGLTQWEYTIAEMLSDAGYATGIFGKWHLGDSDGRYPTDQGFDEWYGIPNSSDESYWPDTDLFRDDVHPQAKYEHVMESRRGETPRNVKVYDIAARRLIDRECTDQRQGVHNEAGRWAKSPSSVSSPTRRLTCRWSPNPEPERQDRQRQMGRHPGPAR